MPSENGIPASMLQEVRFNLVSFEGLIERSELTIPMVQRVGQVKSSQTVLRIVCPDVICPVVKICETEEGEVYGPSVKLLGTVVEKETVSDSKGIMPGIVAGGILVYRYFEKSVRLYKNYPIPGQVNNEGKVIYTPYPQSA